MDTNETNDLTPYQRIARIIEHVEPGSLRFRALMAALDYSGGWIDLARQVRDVEASEGWTEWGYDSFPAYCRDELQLGRGAARKVREGYQWLEDEAPELLEARPSRDDVHVLAPPSRPVPDLDTVDQLVRGFREMREELVPEPAYRQLKEAALEGLRSPHQLRREFKEAVPEERREADPADPRKHFKSALKSLEKALEDLEKQGAEGDPALADRARRLRDEVLSLVAEDEGDEG